jgi:hypothetical protein
VAARGTTTTLLGGERVYRDIYEHGLLERQFADAVEARVGEERSARIAGGRARDGPRTLWTKPARFRRSRGHGHVRTIRAIVEAEGGGFNPTLLFEGGGAGAMAVRGGKRGREARVRVWQPGGHLMRERGAQVEDWSWQRTRRRARDAVPAHAAVQDAHTALDRLAAAGDRDRARPALPLQVRRRRGHRAARPQQALVDRRRVS